MLGLARASEGQNRLSPCCLAANIQPGKPPGHQRFQGTVGQRRRHRRARVVGAVLSTEGGAMLTFAEFLTTRRAALGMSMTELAQHLSVTPQYISLLEAAKCNPSRKLQGRCADFFPQGDSLAGHPDRIGQPGRPGHPVFDRGQRGFIRAVPSDFVDKRDYGSLGRYNRNSAISRICVPRHPLQRATQRDFRKP